MNRFARFLSSTQHRLAEHLLPTIQRVLPLGGAGSIPVSSSNLLVNLQENLTIKVSS